MAQIRDPRVALRRLLVAVAVVGAIVVPVRPSAVEGSDTHVAATAAVRGHWGQVLGQLDRRRARAFARGDVAALSAVYRAGSVVLRRDRAALRGYVERDLSVRGARFRLLDVAVRRARPEAVVLRVVDRLRPSTVRGNGVRLPLPRDRPTVHRVVLARSQGEWRIAAVDARSG